MHGDADAQTCRRVPFEHLQLLLIPEDHLIERVHSGRHMLNHAWYSIEVDAVYVFRSAEYYTGPHPYTPMTLIARSNRAITEVVRAHI